MTKHITRYYVFLDSNAIRDEQWIKRDFFARIERIRNEKLAEIRFYLPEIVSQEWIHHFTSISKKNISQVDRFDRQLSEMGIKQHSPLNLTELDIQQTAKKLLKTNKITIIETPYDEIDWPDLIERAVKHSPPFHPETDKGVKDAVLAKTIIHYATKHKNRPNQQIIAITYDKTLKSYLEEMSNNPPIAQFETIEDFASDLRLKVDELSTDLQRQAKNLFFTLGDESSLYYKAKIYNEIKSLYNEHIKLDGPQKHISALPPEKIKSSYGLPNDEDWNPLDSKPFITGTSFIKRNGSTLHWQTTIGFKQAYALSTFNSYDGMVFNNPSTVIHTAQFKVSWTARIRNNKLITSRLVSVNLTDESAEVDEFPNVDYQTGTTNLTRTGSLRPILDLSNISKIIKDYNATNTSTIVRALKSISTIPNPTSSIQEAFNSITKQPPENHINSKNK